MSVSSRACSTVKNRKTLSKVEYIIKVCVQDWGLDIMNLSELGSHRQGLHACRPPIHADDTEIFQTYPHPFVRVNNNYLTAWAFDADTAQFGVQAATDKAEILSLTSPICKPEMVVHTFRNGDGVTLVLGNVAATEEDDDSAESMD